jgi:hypothetical protein
MREAYSHLPHSPKFIKPASETFSELSTSGLTAAYRKFSVSESCRRWFEVAWFTCIWDIKCVYTLFPYSMRSHLMSRLLELLSWFLQKTNKKSDRSSRSICEWCRSEWPHGLRHELSSPARTMGSWVRIPLRTWMSVCVYSVCVVLCVGSGLATGWSLVQGVLLTVYKIKKLRKRPRSNQRTVEPCRNMWMIQTLFFLLP